MDTPCWKVKASIAAADSPLSTKYKVLSSVETHVSTLVEKESWKAGVKKLLTGQVLTVKRP